MYICLVWPLYRVRIESVDSLFNNVSSILNKETVEGSKSRELVCSSIEIETL